jgi:hypothetical protein
VADYCNSPTTLTLSIPNGPSLDLMSDQNGFRVDTVDLGFPDVREDIDLMADQRGILDYTRLFGARAVSISGSIVPSPYGSRQAAFHALAPFLDPRARTTLTYQIDGDTTPRTMTLRASQLSGPISHPAVSTFSVGWKAADPAAYGPAQQSICRPSVGAVGRAYSLTFPRTYPPFPGATSALTNNGDLTTYPLLRVYGPITNPNVHVQFTRPGEATQYWQLAFTYNLSGTDRIDIDCFNRTALLNGDPRSSVYYTMVFNGSGIGWPYMPAGLPVLFSLNGTGTSSGTQLQINYSDAFVL